MNRLRQFWHAARKVLDLPRRLRGVRDHRADPQVPTCAVSATLILGRCCANPPSCNCSLKAPAVAGPVE